MSYYPEPDCRIRDKIKVVLDLWNYALKKELDHARGVGTSDVVAKKILLLWKLKLKFLNWLIFQLVWIIEN